MPMHFPRLAQRSVADRLYSRRGGLAEGIRRAICTHGADPAIGKLCSGRCIWLRSVVESETPAVNAVARIMIEAVDMATGFCTMPLAEIARRASCSTTTVKQARSKLNECGLWVHAKGGAFVPCPTSRLSQGLNRN